jgi:hypothetical protein
MAKEEASVRPRCDKLVDYRVLVLDEHSLCSTAKSVGGALDALAEKLAKAGGGVSRDNPHQPNLARTTRNYLELLAAFFNLDLSPDERVKYATEAQVLSPENQSLPAYGLRGLTIFHPEWNRATRERAGRRCSRTSTCCSARRCRLSPSRKTSRSRKRIG